MTSTTHTPNELAEALEGEKRVVAFYKAKTTGLEAVQKALVEAIDFALASIKEAVLLSASLNGNKYSFATTFKKLEAALEAAEADVA